VQHKNPRMARLIFRLRNVPDDEAAEVRDLLDAHALSYYETSAGNWGISMPGLWLNNDEDYPEARRLLDAYQHERAMRMREQHLADKAAGRADSQLDILRREPLKVISFFVLIGAFLYLSITAFFRL
jgi:hypothetical protein